jgi:hypothetical protein
MKHLHYLALAAALAAAPAFAQRPATVGESDFVAATAQPASPLRTAAMRDLHRFAARFAADAGQLPKGFPLDVRDVGQLRHARLGWGFQVYDVSRAALMSGADMEADAQPTGIWRYEVLLHGRPIGLLTMARSHAGWSMVSLGGAHLVNDIQDVVGAYGSQAGTRFRYVRVPQATADFIQVKHGAAAARYAPLQAARGALRLQAQAAGGAGLLQADALQSRLRQALARDASN